MAGRRSGKTMVGRLRGTLGGGNESREGEKKGIGCRKGRERDKNKENEHEV